MTPRQIKLVQQSFTQIEPVTEQTATLLYDRLFVLAPELKPLFADDIHDQGRKLMQVIATAVHNLDRLAEVTPAVQALGRRHADYGVEEGHYGLVAVALLWALERSLDKAFTAEVQEAWTVAYMTLAETMKAGMRAAA
jgi:hemoglobin-like flavoprotein